MGYKGCWPIAKRVKSSDSIEGFHDAVRTPCALRPGRHVGFFLEQQNML